MRTEPAHIELVVSDTGCGIPQDHLRSIFDRFWQGDRTSGGAGLGLAIVKGIVDSHGGEIAVESPPGRGTTFRLRLPRNEAAAAAAPPMPQAAPRQVSAAPPGSN